MKRALCHSPPVWGMQLAQRKVGWVHCGEQPRAPVVWGSPAGETGGRRGGGNPSRGEQAGWWLGERGVGVGMNQTFPQEQRRGQGKNPGGRVGGWVAPRNAEMTWILFPHH